MLSKVYGFIFRKCPVAATLFVVTGLLNAYLLPYSFIFLEVMIDNLVAGVFAIGDIIIYAGLLIGIAVCGYIANISHSKIKAKSSHAFATKFIDKVQRVDYDFFEDTQKLDLLEMVKENPETKVLEYFYSTQSVLCSFTQIVSLLVLIGRANIFLSVAYIALIGLVICLDTLSMNQMNKLFEHQSKKERYTKEYERYLYARPSLLFLRVTCGLGFFRKRLMSYIQELLAERITTTKQAQRYSILSRILCLVWLIGSLTTLVYLFTYGWIELGLFITVAAALNLSIDASESLAVSASQVVEKRFFCRKIFEFMDYAQPQPRLATTKNCQGGEIIFQNVSFSYPNSALPVLNNFNLALSMNQCTAFVGANGSGKSTIVKLLLGFYTPQQGTITINGQNVTDYSREDMAQIFGVVFQDFARFEMSLRNNVALGNIEEMNNDDLIYEALRLSGYGEDGADLDSEIGLLFDDGKDLSGGKWQRLAIARALFGNKEFIVFDEALASVDPIQEAAMYLQMNSILENRGGLIISHRMASAIGAARIIVIDGGKLVEDGTHTTLLEQNGLYASFYAEQSKWYKEEE